jgi:hypothetical protein
LEIIGRCGAPQCVGRVQYDVGTNRDLAGGLGACNSCGSVYRLIAGQDRPVSGPALEATAGAGPGDLDLRTEVRTTPVTG